MIVFRNINDEYDSYNYLVEVYNRNKDRTNGVIDISFRDVSFVTANACSMLGAIFQKWQASFNTIRISDIGEKVQNILQRNGFLAFLGWPRIPDYQQTTIPYLKISPRNSRFFGEYICDDLLSKEAMPSMSPRLKKKVTEGIYEIFINAAMHSETQHGIFTCGQFFPKKHLIEFMVTDLGIGIKNRVNRYLNASFSAADAIEWAMEERNTTKDRDSGGLGLAILKDFIKLNKGRIQMVSNDGFWELSEKNGIVKKAFSGEFPGTAVNICIKTDDQMHYVLSNESINDEELF